MQSSKSCVFDRPPDFLVVYFSFKSRVKAKMNELVVIEVWDYFNKLFYQLSFRQGRIQ